VSGVFCDSCAFSRLSRPPVVTISCTSIVEQGHSCARL
jgi:hypothetical protein